MTTSINVHPERGASSASANHTGKAGGPNWLSIRSGGAEVIIFGGDEDSDAFAEMARLFNERFAQPGTEPASDPS